MIGQCRFISRNQVITLVGDTDNWEGLSFIEAGGI